MAILFLGEKLIQNANAGSKARLDIETILNKKYKKYLDLDNVQFSDKRPVRILQNLSFLGKSNFYSVLNKLNRSSNDTFIIQYPFYYNKVYKKELYKFVHTHKCVLIVHDVDALRGFYNNYIHNLKEEIDFLNNAAVLILHNSIMTDYLRRNGLTAPVVDLQIFDYLLQNENPAIPYKLCKMVSFAGNLKKSLFLEKLSTTKLNIHFNLYGNGLPASLKDTPDIEWKGSFSAEDIPYHLSGGFGLVWDGTSLDTCDGNMGNYMRYNNPHKLSLYIAAGLPAVVWEEAAIAKIVKEYHIGIAVKSLHDLNSAINNVTEPQYKDMLNNISELQKLVTTGHYTAKTLNQVEELVND